MNISSHLNFTLDDPSTYYHQTFVTRPPNFEIRQKSIQCRKKNYLASKNSFLNMKLIVFLPFGVRNIGYSFQCCTKCLKGLIIFFYEPGGPFFTIFYINIEKIFKIDLANWEIGIFTCNNHQKKGFLMLYHIVLTA